MFWQLELAGSNIIKPFLLHRKHVTFVLSPIAESLLQTLHTTKFWTTKLAHEYFSPWHFEVSDQFQLDSEPVGFWKYCNL